MAIEPNPRYQQKIDAKNASKGERQRSNDDEEPKPRPRREREYVQSNEKPAKASFENIALILSWIVVVITFPFCLFFCYITVAEYHRAVFFRLGRARKGALGPGLVWFLPCIDTYGLVDLRTRVEVLPSQEMITKDSVSISVDAVVFYCIDGSLHASIRIANVHETTVLLAQTTLRNIVGSQTLHELLTSRESLSRDVEIAVNHATAKWGVKIERVDIKDINLPESLQRALASEAEALREARAKIISAEGEAMASQALKEASDVMIENKITLQLRHLQVLQSIATERRVTLIYPFPMEFMAPFGPTRKAQNKIPDTGTTNSPMDSAHSILRTMLDTYLMPSDASGSTDEYHKSFLQQTNDDIHNDFHGDKTDDATEAPLGSSDEEESANKAKAISTREKETEEQPTGQEPSGEQPTGEQPSREEPSGEQPSGGQPSGGNPTGEEPSREEPSGEQSNPGETQPQPPTSNDNIADRSAGSQTNKRDKK